MSETILIVDDDVNLLSAMRRQLRSRFSIVTAQGGEEAIERIKTGAPVAAVLCDMRMGGMNGVETLKAIRDLSPDTVRMMLTGNADMQTAIDAINDGNIFRFLTKPCPPEMLEAGLSAALALHNLLSAERRLAENEERWRLALESVGDGVWDWAPPSNAATYSDSWHRMLGLVPPQSALTVFHWWERIHPQDATMVSKQIERMIKGEDSVFLCEHRLLCADGSYRWFLGRGVVLYRADDGSAQRVIGTHSDVTERRLRMAALGRMAAGFAHEINTPIGVALTAISEEQHTLKKIDHMLSQDAVSEEELREELNSIDRADQLALANLRRCSDMVLRFKRSFVDQTSEQPRNYDMAEVIEDVLFCLNNEMRNLPIKLDIDCPAGIGIDGVPAHVEQILTNLILNALKHAFDEGSREGTIRLKVGMSDYGRVKLVFSDDGRGMSDEDAQRAFDPFFTTARDRGGSGLGLFLCYNLVTVELGGNISCRSEPGKGTEFVIEFPVTLAKNATKAPEGIP